MSSGCAAGSVGVGRVARGEARPSRALDAGDARGLARHRRQFGRVDQQLRVAAVELDAQLVDIGLRAAEAGRQRQRHRPRAGIDRAEEQRGEFRRRSRRPARCDRRARRPRAIRRCAIASASSRSSANGIGAGERAARIVEIQPARAARGIIERFAQRGEIGEAARQRVVGRVVADRPSPSAGQHACSPSSDLPRHVRTDASCRNEHGSCVSRIQNRLPTVAQTWPMTRPAPPRPPARRGRARPAGAALCRAVRDDAGETGALSGDARLRERGWAGDAPRPIRRRWPSGWPGSAISTTARLPRRRRARWRGAGWARGGCAGRCGRPGVGEADARGGRAGAGDAALERRSPSRGASGSARSRLRCADRPLREKQIAAMLRGGHGFALARAIAMLAPGEDAEDALARIRADRLG